MATKTFQIDDFEVAVTPYNDCALIIIHNGIPGCGTIMQTENYDGDLETSVMIGKDEEMLHLLAMQIAKHIAAQTIEFIFSFKPEKFDSFEKVQDFVAKFFKHFQQ